MLSRQKQIHTQVHQIVDTALFGVALWVAHRLRLWTDGSALWPMLGGQGPIEGFSDFVWLYLVLLPFTPLLLDWAGFYRRPMVATRRETAWTLAKACAVAVLGMILIMFVLKIALARSVIILFGGVCFGLVMLKEEIVRRWLLSRYGASQFRLRAILLGSPEDTARLRRELGVRGAEELETVAELDINHSSAAELVKLLHEHSANAVILSAAHTYFGQVERAIEVCEREGVEVWLLADFFKTQVSRTTLDELMGRPTLVFRSAPEASWQRVAKDFMDILGALVLVLLALVPMAVIALLIRLTSPGPVLFRQQRSGLHGRPFNMLKFRTMVTNAEQLKIELAALNEMSGPVFKITNDPRVTKVGRFLRRWSLDELPQLFNVLRGEMSLVGPRPLPVAEVERFDDPADRRRLSVKPGLTCLWQVGGRNEVRSFKDWVQLDLEYIDHWSLWLDLKILARTIPAVLRGTGAK
jgi:exopolysaccharide biosynthesis polyprenyl glycosylphosphotransferase